MLLGFKNFTYIKHSVGVQYNYVTN